MKILVLNSGSSSLKYQLIDMSNEEVLIKGHVDGIGLESCVIKYSINNEKFKENIHVKNHSEAIKKALNSIEKVSSINEINAIGHRVVHGGEKYTKSVIIDSDVIKTIEELIELAPLHNPANLEGIKACEELGIKQVAVFDTSFHQTMQKKAYLYGLPYEFYVKYGVRKYGFHGTSHKFLMEESKKILNKNKVNIITCHIGNGSSITAIKENKSIDTTMGFTPLPGVMMGTRSGDFDPSIIEFLMNKEGKDISQVMKILNKESGLKGISGSSDMREIYENKNERNKLTIDMLSYQIALKVGSFVSLMPKIDAIIFSAGLGENAFYLREKICKNLEFLGIEISKERNEKNALVVSTDNSKIKVLVIPTNEELMIAKETVSLI